MDRERLTRKQLIVEIAASSASYDLHDKLRAYRRNGVREYLVWLMQEQAFRWYQLQEGDYGLQQPDELGVVHFSKGQRKPWALPLLPASL